MVSNLRQNILCILLTYVACSYQNICGIACLGHDITMIVEIVIVAIVGHNANYGYALFDVDAYMSAQCLIAFGLLYKRTLL